MEQVSAAGTKRAPPKCGELDVAWPWAKPPPLRGGGGKVAGWEHLCRLCPDMVLQGDEIHPVKKPEGRGVNPGGVRAGSFSWCHVACARAHGGAAGLEGLEKMGCPFFARTGRCAHGDNCFYAHVEGPPLAEQMAARPKVGSWQRQKLRNTARFGCLRRWLLDEFGVALLSEGAGVLDIAGGKGELAFELENLNRVPVTVVDPRPLVLAAYRRRQAMGLYWRNSLMLPYIAEGVLPESPHRAPRHLQCMFDAPLLAALPCSSRPAQCDGVGVVLEEAARARGVSTAAAAAAAAAAGGGGGGGAGGGRSPFAVSWAAAFRASMERGNAIAGTRRSAELAQHQKTAARCQRAEAAVQQQPPSPPCQSSEGRVISAADEALAAIVDCSVVVGMHPDQAVGPLLAFAIAARKPFACVPCCVYSKHFPRRRIPGAAPGAQVRSHKQLVEHLQSLHPDIRVHELDFEGKNKLLYWRPE